MDVVMLRAGQLLRRRWRATVLLALLAGLTGGLAMAAFSIGRRASTAFDRFLAFSEPADLIVNFCPPELETIDDETVLQCFAYDAVEETAVATSLPEVDDAGRVVYMGTTISSPSQPGRTFPASTVVTLDSTVAPVDGAPIMVAGRRPADAAADEVAINERLAELTGATVGSQLVLTFWSTDEAGAVPGAEESFHGPQVRTTVVGIERNVRDLTERVGTADSTSDESRVSAAPGFAEAVRDAGRFAGMAVWAANGERATLAGAIDEAFAGRLYNVTPVLEDDDRDPISEAIRYEAAGTMLFGAITALAAVVFAGQAVSRQSRREWLDGPTLRNLGMARDEAAGAALVRGAVTGVLAAVLALITALALSAVRPFGLAGRIDLERGPILDLIVLGIGAVAVLAVVVVCTWFPVVRQFRRRRAELPSTRARLGGLRSHLPPPAAAGVSMTVNGRGGGGLPLGTALAGLTLAFVTALAAVGLTASLDDLTGSAMRFGASWDLSASAAVQRPDEVEALRTLVGELPEVQAAAALLGTDAVLAEDVAWVQAYAPVDGVTGVLGPVITAGRVPQTVEEIALGARTMVDQGLSIGDVIDVEPTTSRSGDASRMTIVGTAVINDNSENNPGRGAIVTPGWMDRFAPESSATTFVMDLRPGADLAAVSAALAPAATAGVTEPVRQGAIRNLERVRAVPLLLAIVVGVLAVASLAHALVLSVRRQRAQLAVFKTIGFRRGQVGLAVAFHASTLVLLAAVVGIPLGIIAARWGWRLVTDGIGVVSPSTTSALWVLGIVLGTVVIANVVAAFPGWVAAHEPTAESLRAE